MKRIVNLIIFLLCFPLISFADVLVLSTGGTAGTYFAYGTVLANYVSNNSNVTITAVAGTGSADNIDALDVEGAQLALVQNDIAYYAMNGIRFERYKGKPVTSFTALAALYTETVQLVTCNPDIKSVADLRGKKVAVGSYGYGVYFNAMDFLAAYDMTEADINPQYLSFGDSAEALKDGKLDAAFVVASAPTPAVTDLASCKTTYLVPLDAIHINMLQERSPFYTVSTIPAGTYSNQTKDVMTVGLKATLIANGQVSEEQAYTIVKTIFDGKEQIASAHSKGNNLNIDFASTCGLPYHPGALRYYTEYSNTNKPDLILPADLKEIGAESFKNIKSGTIIKIPPGITSISSTAFSDDVILLCQENSDAQTICEDLGLTVITYPQQ